MTGNLPDHQECDWQYPETYQCRSCSIIAAEMDYPHFCGAAADACAHVVCVGCWNDAYESGKHECPLCHKNVEAWLNYNYPRSDGTVCEACNTRHNHNGWCTDHHLICDNCWSVDFRCPICNSETEVSPD